MSELQNSMGQKVNRMPFFPIFREKSTFLMPIFCQKKRLFNIKHSALMPTYCQQNVHFLKNAVLWCHIFQFCHEKPSVSYLYLPKERHFCSNYTIFWATNDNSMPYPIFHEKNHCSHAHILSKRCLFSKNTLLSCPYFVKKSSIF